MLIQVIQLTESDLTFARFSRSGRDQLRPLTGLRLPYADREELAALLRDQLPPAPRQEEVRTILALPPPLVTLRELRLPFTDRRKLRAVLPLELGADTAQGDQELVADALPLADGSLLAGWALRDAVADLIELLTAAELEPEVVTLAALHWNLLLPPGLTGIQALADRQGLTLCDGETGALLYSRTLRTDDPATLQRTLTSLELERSLTVAALFTIDGELPGEPSAVPPPQPLPLPQPLTELPSEGPLPPAALALPLAVARAYCSGEIFNLRSNSLAWTRQNSRLLRRFRTTLILAAIALLLFIGEAGSRWWLLTRDLDSLNHSIARIYHNVFPNRKKAVDEEAEIHAEIRRLEGGIATPSMLAFLNSLAADKGTRITGLSEIDYDGSRFTLRGESSAADGVGAFRQRLATEGWQVDEPEITTRPDGATLFVLKGHQRGGSAL